MNQISMQMFFLQEDCPIESFVVTNSSGGNALASGTDYTLTKGAGTFVMINSTASVGYIPRTANETGFLNNSGYTLADSTKSGFAAPVTISITNTTDGKTIIAANYTLTGNVLKNATAEQWASVKITYTYQYNNALVDYTYCNEGYMDSSWGRTVINLVPGFFALAILGASLLLFYSVAKDFDII